MFSVLKIQDNFKDIVSSREVFEEGSDDDDDSPTGPGDDNLEGVDEGRVFLITVIERIYNCRSTAVQWEAKSDQLVLIHSVNMSPKKSTSLVKKQKLWMGSVNSEHVHVNLTGIVSSRELF